MPYLTVAPKESISVQIFNHFSQAVVPASVQPIMTQPPQGVMTIIKISFFMSLLFSMPYLIYSAVDFVSPALYSSEKKMLQKTMIPVGAVFLTALSYWRGKNRLATGFAALLGFLLWNAGAFI